MRFSQSSLLILSSAVSSAAAEGLDELIGDFSTISAADSAAFSLWRDSYENAYKTFVVSYFDKHGSQEGLATADMSSLERILLATADHETTEGYSFFYDQLVASETLEYYATDDYEAALETGYETGFETGYETILETGYETAETADLYGTDGYYTTISDSYATRTGSALNQPSITPSPNFITPRQNAVAAFSGFSSVIGSAHSSHKNSTEFKSYQASSTNSASSTRSSSSVGMGGHQSPVIAGAVLALFSVLFS